MTSSMYRSVLPIAAIAERNITIKLGYRGAGWRTRTTPTASKSPTTSSSATTWTAAICLLLACKIKYPENFFLLRGNHDCASINRIYGFYDECKRWYNIKLWKTFTDCFNCLPVAAAIFCCHGGLSPDLQSMEQIRRIMRPTDVPDQTL